MSRSNKWTLGGRIALFSIILSLQTLGSYAQSCYASGAPLPFSISGNNTTPGYTTVYVLTNEYGEFLQVIDTNFTTPINTSPINLTYKIYAINYNSQAPNTPPNLTPGTNILTGAGASCVAISSAPISFCVLPTTTNACAPNAGIITLKP